MRYGVEIGNLRRKRKFGKNRFQISKKKKLYLKQSKVCNALILVRRISLPYIRSTDHGFKIRNVRGKQKLGKNGYKVQKQKKKYLKH